MIDNFTAASNSASATQLPDLSKRQPIVPWLKRNQSSVKKKEICKSTKIDVYRLSRQNGIKKSCAEGLNMLFCMKFLSFHISRARTVLHGWMISRTG